MGQQAGRHKAGWVRWVQFRDGRRKGLNDANGQERPEHRSQTKTVHLLFHQLAGTQVRREGAAQQQWSGQQHPTSGYWERRLRFPCGVGWGRRRVRVWRWGTRGGGGGGGARGAGGSRVLGRRTSGAGTGLHMLAAQGQGRLTLRLLLAASKPQAGSWSAGKLCQPGSRASTAGECVHASLAGPLLLPACLLPSGGGGEG